MNRSQLLGIMILLSVILQGSAFEGHASNTRDQATAVPGTGSATAQDQVATPIRIDILHSLTGPMAVRELPLVAATRMAIAELNDRGGILGRPLEAIVEDGASDPLTFGKEARQLIIDDNVVSIFGCWTYFQSIESASNRRFVREFRKRYAAERVTDDAIEAAYSQVYLFAEAVEKAGSTDVEAIRHAARGLISAAPRGMIRVDQRNLHTWKFSHIGRIEPSGQFRIVWTSEDPFPPYPFLPATFIAKADCRSARCQ